MPAKKTAFSLRYLPYEYHGRVIRLPAARVKITDDKESSISSFALVDSGATVSFLPLELVEILDCPLAGEDIPSEGAGGCFNSKKIKLTVYLLKGKKACWTGKVDFLVPTEHDRIPYVVLGRDSVFRSFDITFCEYSQRTLFRKATGNRSTTQSRRKSRS